MYLVILSNADPSHYAMSFIPLLILPITIILSLISENIRINKTMCLLLITLLFAWSGITTCIQEIYGNIIGKYDKTFYNTIANYVLVDMYIFRCLEIMYPLKQELK